MKKTRRIASFLCAAVLAVTCLGGCGKQESAKSLLDPKNPISISIWNYYNGAQLAAFNEMVDSFNETRGKELGIVVSSVSQGSVNDLHTNTVNAITGKVGAEEVPNIFAAYADTAYEVDQMGALVNLADYLSQEQRELYIDGYLTEGDF
ncbi:MAG: ABC transporter substrate-binding protein, partial [Faecousia sp.]